MHSNVSRKTALMLNKNVDSRIQLTVGLYSIYRIKIIDPALRCLPYKDGGFSPMAFYFFN